MRCWTMFPGQSCNLLRRQGLMNLLSGAALEGVVRNTLSGFFTELRPLPDIDEAINDFLFDEQQEQQAIESYEQMLADDEENLQAIENNEFWTAESLQDMVPADVPEETPSGGQSSASRRR
eukprot:m.252919 g.252919  ORF g.252919 m.252919 type:complete len:121 (-) comp17191_c0_seq15:4456-4818(-)